MTLNTASTTILKVNIDKILHFWDQHNITIIESLIALVIILSLFLAFRGFFSNEEKLENKPNDNLEKALQALLEKQTTEKGSLHGDAAAIVADSVANVAAERDNSTELLAEKAKKISALEVEIENLKSQLLKSPAEGEMVDRSEVEGLQIKVQELEGRLSDYEIISEDIADITRLKKENEQLRKELETLKQTQKSVPTPSVSTEWVQEEVDAILNKNAQSPTAVEEETSEDLQEQIAALAEQNIAATGEEIAPELQAEASEEQKDDSYVDDEFMQEFQDAVLAQKNLDQNAETIGKEKADLKVAAKDIAASDIEMLNQFSEFTEKKKP